MTTIAWDGSTLAADRAYFEDGVITGEGPKLCQSPDGIICGVAGNGSLCAAFMRWHIAQSGTDPCPSLGDSDEHCAEAIIVAPTNPPTIVRHDRMGHYIVTGKIAIGRGAELALGAMDAGANAYTAVHLAIQRLGGDPRAIDVLALPLREPKQEAMA